MEHLINYFSTIPDGMSWPMALIIGGTVLCVPVVGGLNYVRDRFLH